MDTNSFTHMRIKKTVVDPATETKARKTPTRSPEYEEARIKKELRQEREARVKASEKWKASDKARADSAAKLEEELAAVQARMNPSLSFPL